MYLIYNTLLWLALPFVVLYHLYRSVSRGRTAALPERFGFICPELRKSLAGSPPIWVHAVSVGETIAVKPLLKALKERYPDRRLVISTMTETGRSVASQIPEVDCCIRFPFDYRFSVRRLLSLVDPELIIIVETEIWPNFLRRARLSGIPTLIANGRISDRSFGRYLRLRRFFQAILGDVTAFCMQSEADAQRVVAMGADPARVAVARNLKFDIPVTEVSPGDRSDIRERYRLPQTGTIITAGSTHPGEEEQVIAAFTEFIGAGMEAVLILVPRHPERAGEAAALLRQAGLPFVLRSNVETQAVDLGTGEVLLVDTIGELMRFYSVSDLVFVGGSLVPVGGHNVLEPASLGVPVIFGPHMSNFREIAGLSIDYGAARQVSDGASLGTVMQELLADVSVRRVMGENGRRLVREQGGATDRHLAAIEKIVRSAG